MENTKLPAYPTTTDNANEIYEVAGKGFTKIEMASLMIAQGMVSGIGQNPIVYQSVASSCVLLAKAVLEEANK